MGGPGENLTPITKDLKKLSCFAKKLYCFETQKVRFNLKLRLLAFQLNLSTFVSYQVNISGQYVKHYCTLQLT